LGTGRIIDPDAIARRIDSERPEAAAVAAGREAIRQQSEAIAVRESFTVETTLSGARTMKLMDEAGEAGFRVELHYVSTGDARMNVGRVASRVEQGGHHVPTEDVLRRFARSTENLPRAVAKADFATLYDSSGPAYTRPVADLDREGFAFTETAPAWAKQAAGDAARLWKAEAATVKEESAAMMREAEADHAQGNITAEDLADLREFQATRDSQADRDGPGGLRE
jgi:predicted ABC-type ATPase